MDQETKITYGVVTVLIFILGGLAYFLQDAQSLPQVQLKDEPVKTIKKITNTNTATVSKIVTSTTTPFSTSSMQLPEKITSATITTNKGVIEITFANNTPVTVKNFAALALAGFYNGTRFHRVIRDFMIQGGDPLSKDINNKTMWGKGGPGYSFADEFHEGDALPQGTLAMANSGPNTNGSQFFIVTAIAGTPWLVGKHTVFGHVTKGLETALDINTVETTGSGAGDIPLQDVIIEKIEIH